MMVYIGAAAPLEQVAWNEARPAFSVQEIGPIDQAVRERLDAPFVYLVGAYEGCGCGFQLGRNPQWEDDEAPEKRASLDRFAGFLEKALAQAPVIQVFACWDGDETLPAVEHRSLTPDALRAGSFFFLDRELSVVTRQVSANSPGEPK